ncbi:reverse transcriptase domain-containing protein, partial [Tanacetum coccineum]
MESVQDMSGCGDDEKVKYTAGSFVGKALTLWNSQIYTRSREAAVGMSWEKFKTLTREEFYPVNEMQKLEIEFWNHAMVGAGHAAYTDRFYELARLVPHLVTPENKKIKRYIYGLAPQIRRMVATTKSETIHKDVQKARTLIDEAIRNGSLKRNPEKRRNGREHSRDRNVRDDNMRTKTGNAFAITTNPVRREYPGTIPKYAMRWTCKLRTLRRNSAYMVVVMLMISEVVLRAIADLKSNLDVSCFERLAGQLNHEPGVSFSTISRAAVPPAVRLEP